MIDSRCYDLAKVFASKDARFNTEKNIEDLAIAIQEAIDVWFEMQMDEESQHK